MIMGTAMVGLVWTANGWHFSFRPTYSQEFAGLFAYLQSGCPTSARCASAPSAPKAFAGYVDQVNGVVKLAQTYPDRFVVANSQWVDNKPINVTSQVRDMIATKPDVVMVGTNTAQVVATVQALKDLGAKVPIVTSSHNGLTEVAKAVPLADLEGSYSVFAFAPSKDPSVTRARKIFEKYNKTKGTWGLIAAQTVAQALLATAAMESAIATVGPTKLTGQAMYDALEGPAFGPENFQGLAEVGRRSQRKRRSRSRTSVKALTVKDGKIVPLSTELDARARTREVVSGPPPDHAGRQRCHARAPQRRRRLQRRHPGPAQRQPGGQRGRRSWRCWAANGAGKTTTLRAISSLLAAEQGRVSRARSAIEGEAITNAEPARVIRARHRPGARGPQGARSISTVEQNLLVGAHLRADKAQIADDMAEIYASFPSLEGMRQRTAGYLSGGEMQMLLVGRALMARPRGAAARRAGDGPGAADRQGPVRFPSRRMRDRKGAVASSGGAERTRARCRSPTTATSWRTAASSCTATEAELRAQRGRARVLSRPQPDAGAAELSRRQALQAPQALARMISAGWRS